ncbi:MAG: hypothetical protein GXY75_03785 [Bacteroidales bacterium]|jgi:hypothetical protein|nr:hypothetical protein [Bacteroidales bacterium]
MKTARKTLTMLALFFMTMIGATSCANSQKEVDIKALFDLMPAEAFSMTDWETPAELEEYMAVCDHENRYLRLEFEDQVSWEMCYWDLKDGNKLIAIGYVGGFSYYIYSNGIITSTTDFGVEEMRRSVENSIAMNPYYNWIDFYVPRHGTSVYISINRQDFLIYKWENEQFVQIRDYPTQNNTHQGLVEGFASALISTDADRCLQYVEPSYVAYQCMDFFEGNIEEFICDLIAGENEQGPIKPANLGDIKTATYRYTPEDGFANHIILIELNDGRSYTYYPSLVTVEIFEILENGENGELKTRIPYIIDGLG